MPIKLNRNAPLFKYLKSENPVWWQRLKDDPEIYIDVRKDNSINAYYNGGSIIRLSYKNTRLQGEIHQEYLPLKLGKDYIPYVFSNQDIDFSKSNTELKPLLNFESSTLESIKSRIRKKYPKNSEKGIQGKYVTCNSNFIDSEFQMDGIRIDLVWIGFNPAKIFFVELKTICDERIYFDYPTTAFNVEPIDQQLKKYYDFFSREMDFLKRYYLELFKIKNELGILPKNFNGPFEITDLDIVPKPIFLVGDVSDNWRKMHAPTINSKIKNCAYGAVYHGKNSPSFKIPTRSTKQEFLFK